MSAPHAGSLPLLEAWFRAAARTVAGLTLTPDQCEYIANEIRAEIILDIVGPSWDKMTDEERVAYGPRVSIHRPPESP
jgi:hypothetical protein